MIYELFVSPGCTHAVNIMAFLEAISSSVDSKFVISKSSKSLPARDLQRCVLFMMPLGVYLQSFDIKLKQSVYV
jgi:hypothetical protein